MKKIISIFLSILLISLSSVILIACNKNIEDTSELYEKSTTRRDIVERSGTILRAGSDPEALRNQMLDAENRLRTGGGLFGEKPQDITSMFRKKEKTNSSISSVGFPINPYLWKGSLETISFMSLASADPFAGIIITDWYTSQNSPDERCKLNIFIKGVKLQANNLKVNSFCQTLSENGFWVDQKINIENNIKLENTILNQAKKIKLSQG